MAQIKVISFSIAALLAPAYGLANPGTAAGSYSTGAYVLELGNTPLRNAKTPPQIFSGSLWTSMRQRFGMSEVNPEIVRRQENYFSSHPDYFNRTLVRSQPYLYHIYNEVQRRRMPAEIALLPFVESAFVNKARSRVGASGLWQFMPATGRHYGLEQTALYDGRHDVYAATDAALNYLDYLHSLFGDWSLALAAYNWGENSVGRAVARAQAQGLAPTYENLRMPKETRNYVPKLLAIRNIVNNPSAFGIRLQDIPNRPYFQALDVSTPMDSAAAARLAGISEEEFLKLNPAYKAPVWLPKAGRKMLLPTAAVNTFTANLRRSDPQSLLSWNIYTVPGYSSVSDVAAQTGMNVASLRTLNDLRGNAVTPGTNILVAKNTATSTQEAQNNLRNLDIQLNDPKMTQALAAEKNGDAERAARLEQAAKTEPANLVRDDLDNKINAIQKIVAAPPATPSVPPAQAVAVAAAKPAASATPAVLAQNSAPASKTPAPEAVVRLDTDIAAPAAAATVVAKSAPAGDALNTFLAQKVGTDNGETTQRTASAKAEPKITAKAEAPRKADKDKAEAKAAAAKRTLAQNDTKKTADKRKKDSARFQGPKSYTVKSGDSLYTIAQRNNMDVADLVSLNHLRGSTLRPGQTLKVAEQRGGTSGKQAKIRQTTYTVRSGDTLSAIANRYNVSVSDIRRWNKNSGGTLRPGQKIVLQGS